MESVVGVIFFNKGGILPNLWHSLRLLIAQFNHILLVFQCEICFAAIFGKSDGVIVLVIANSLISHSVQHKFVIRALWPLCCGFEKHVGSKIDKLGSAIEVGEVADGKVKINRQKVLISSSNLYFVIAAVGQLRQETSLILRSSCKSLCCWITIFKAAAFLSREVEHEISGTASYYLISVVQRSDVPLCIIGQESILVLVVEFASH